jgi:hypothetical protein
VLVVTDQSTLRVGRKSCLASTGETEEDGDVAVLALVGGGVESKDIVLDGHLVEEDREDSLFHLTYMEVSFVLHDVVKHLPAYSVPRMTISFSAKLIATDVDEVMPAVYLFAGKAPPL